MFRLTRREQVLIIAFLLVILTVSGIYMYERPSLAEPIPLSLAEQQQTEPSQTGGVKPSESSAKPVAQIQVDVKGEVYAPGVYALPAGSRVIDAIQVAGGFTEQADLDSLNLAQKLQDGSMLLVPKKGAAPALGSTPTAAGTPNSVPKININLATAEQLEQLEGIGSTRSQAIVQYREQNGPFQSVDDLLKIKGIGPKLLETIKDRLVTY